MKTYLTEASIASSAQTTHSAFRRPLKVLQNFQLFHNFNMSSKASVSSPLKTPLNKQRKGESSVQLKESQNRIKTANLTSRRTTSDRNNSRISSKSPSYNKKLETRSDLKSKISESSDGSLTSVGSLTSSPKWSHIKKRFESEESVTSLKTSKTATDADSKKSVQTNRTMKNSLSTSNTENVSFIHRNKYLSSRKNIDKKTDVCANKSETASCNKISVDKPRVNTSNVRNENLKPTSRNASPKNSSLNNPASNISALHSSNLLKNSTGNINSGLRSSHSSISGSENSVKNSRSSSPSTISCSSPTLKSCPSKSSLLNINVDKFVNSSLKSSIDAPRESSYNTTKISTSNSNLNSSVLYRRNAQDSKMNSFRGKQKIEDKPILSFNRASLPSEKLEKAFENKTGRKSLGSELEKNSSTGTKADKILKTNVKVVANSTISNKNISENVEKIKDLAKNSQQASKTIWIKDSAGNWVKKADTENKSLVRNNSTSKVASLRSKFMEPSKACNSPLTKSSTTSNVPSTNTQNSRPLAKSNTTSNICDTTFLSDFSKKLASSKNTVDKKDLAVNADVSKKTNLVVNNKNESSETNPGNDLKLNIVQRAVLSYEGSIALLSPETQKRLKLVTEKVQSQTDDNKILRAKTKSNVLSNSKNSYEKTLSGRNSEPSNIVLKKSSEPSSMAGPVLPVRNFLSRYQMNKALTSKENKVSEENNKNKTSTKSNDARSTFFSGALSSGNNKAIKNSLSSSENASDPPKKIDLSSTKKSVTKLTMNLKLPNGQIDMKTNNQENDYALQPNSSFLWRHSEIAPSELSKSSTASSVSLTSSDYRNYYDIENYYSSLELEIEKGSENSDEHIYIDSQESNSSENNYASSVYSAYQNVPKEKQQRASHNEWIDARDGHRKNSVSSNQSSTLKKRRNKRYSSHRDNSMSTSKSQSTSEQRKHHLNDTMSFNDSNDTLINDEIGNESTFDLSDINHLYEPVYESLGNYLLNPDEENYENCSVVSLSPDEPETEDFMQCSITSLESTESNRQDTGEVTKQNKEETDDKNAANKKAVNKISQLKRHLSWTKNDIRLELSSKFNKIKIKKNGRNSTEIGLKVQDSENANTSPKKKTFIKCILRQKSASSIPTKRSPSPKKESAMFYVHLTMGREKQQRFSDSVLPGGTAKDSDEVILKSRKQSDSALQFNNALKCNQQQPRGRKFASSHTIQRPKTPPPLPPVQSIANFRSTLNQSFDEKTMSTSTLVCDSSDLDAQFYTVLDSEYMSSENQKQPSYENEVLRLIHGKDNKRVSDPISLEKNVECDTSSTRDSNISFRKHSNDLNLSLLQSFQTENLKSPFEEEPMYQFYQKDVQQRATLWYSIDGSESEFEDDSRLCDYQSLKRPILQSQLSAMELLHGEGGQRRLWCEVPEVVESGILKTISPNDRKIQEAMFEVITSEASYLKSLNFLIEHFVQCTEFSGDYTEKHILDKRERHVLFSDIQPVRDVSASLLADLEKRWMTYIVLSDICDILYHHASKYFSVYVKYCSNQIYQDRLLRELKEKRPEFFAVLKRLESSPVCQGLNMHSFLMLPMQRITRMPLLIDAIFRRLSVDSSIYESCKLALGTVNKIVAECNEGACKMQRMEEMLVISQQIDFKACKGLGLLSASRWLVKKGDLVQLIMDNASRRTFGRSSRWCKIQLYLFLFTDLLVVTRKKSDDNYSVVDYCPRNMLQVMPIDENTPPLPIRLPSSYRNVFQLIMLNNRDGKTVEMLLSCLLESDRTRWMDAVRPAKSENPDEKIYEEWDCPQVQCTHSYNALQPDELSLEEADVVNVFKKMSDGWFEGERIRDGIRGWFPSSHTVEIINSHVRARNLHQRYRLLMLSQTYLEEQQKAQAQQAKK